MTQYPKSKGLLSGGDSARKELSININLGVDATDMNFLHYMEKQIDSVMVPNGFTRTNTTKEGDRTIFNYRQFGMATGWPE